MRRICLMVIVLTIAGFIYAQEMTSNTPLLQRLSIADSWNTKRCQIFLNMQGGYNLNFHDGDFDEGVFRMKQFRIEAKGEITDWLSYRYRQRLNRSNDGSGNIDNLPGSIDIAGIGVKLSDKWSFFAGKQCTVYGGIEFDLNPIEIYEYSDMIEYMSNFMTGINVCYDLTSTQQFQAQILDSRVNSLEETYGVSPKIQKAKLPLVYTLNWNGNFGDWLSTRWSFSFMNEAKKEHMYYYAFGNKVQFGKFGAYFDLMYSRQGLDRKGIISETVGTVGHNAFDADYWSWILHANYFITDKWNIFVKGMYETASVYKANDGVEKGLYRTSWGYMGGVEFYPMADGNLHFFLMGVGRSYDYTKKAKTLGNDNYNTMRVELGMVYKLPVL